MIDLTLFTVSPETRLRDVVACIDRNAKGIALVVDAERRLLFTMTDGDLRRAVLHGLDLEMSAGAWAALTLGPTHAPVTAPHGTSRVELLKLMTALTFRHVPLLDSDGRVVDLALLSDVVAEAFPQHAVVMAGGLGTRLRPLTADLPKPMLPVGDRPLMEHILQQLHESGIRHVSITTHYKPETIVEHFGNGAAFGVELNYVHEDRPLGTAGALGLLPPWNSPLLVINGDILTRVNHQSMLVFHQENRAMVTVGVRQYDVQVPYGVLETAGLDVRAVSEKPTLSFFVNAGVYLLEPVVQQYLAPGQRADMTDLLGRLLAEKHRVICFPISEYWLDIGRHADYEKAQAEFSQETS